MSDLALRAVALAILCGCSEERVAREETRIEEPVREQPAPAPRVIAIGIGMEGCAVLEGGRVACWPLDAVMPRAELVPDVEHAVETDGDCARTDAGRVVCWRGRAPDGLAPVRRIERGCALAEDGTIVCWGGLTLDVSALQARPILGVEGAIDLSCDLLRMRCLALARGGRVWSFGADTPPEPREEPGALSVAVGLTEGCVRTESRVICSGLGTTYERVEIPIRTRAIAADARVCAITEAGGVACWGIDEGGYDSTPEELGGVSNVEELRMAREHVCARLEDGTVWCWHDDRPELRAQVILPVALSSVP